MRGSKTLGDKTLGTQDRRFKTLREKRLTHGLTRVDPECKKASDTAQRALIQNVRRKISFVTHESTRVSPETHFPRAKGPAATTDGKAKRFQASLFSLRCKRSRIKSVFRILARRKLGREQNTIDCRIFLFRLRPSFRATRLNGALSSQDTLSYLIKLLLRRYIKFSYRVDRYFSSKASSETQAILSWSLATCIIWLAPRTDKMN